MMSPFQRVIQQLLGIALSEFSYMMITVRYYIIKVSYFANSESVIVYGSDLPPTVVNKDIPYQKSVEDYDDFLIQKFFTNQQLSDYSRLFDILKRVTKDEGLSYNKKLKL